MPDLFIMLAGLLAFDQLKISGHPFWTCVFLVCLLGECVLVAWRVFK